MWWEKFWASSKSAWRPSRSHTLKILSRPYQQVWTPTKKNSMDEYSEGDEGNEHTVYCISVYPHNLIPLTKPRRYSSWIFWNPALKEVAWHSYGRHDEHLRGKSCAQIYLVTIAQRFSNIMWHGKIRYEIQACCSAAARESLCLGPLLAMLVCKLFSNMSLPKLSTLSHSLRNESGVRSYSMPFATFETDPQDP